MHVGFLRRAGTGRERAGLARHGTQLRHQRAHHALAEAGADAADIDQFAVLALAAMDAGEQRAQAAAFAGPAADHHLVAGAALGLGPAITAAGLVGRVQLLGDDALEVHAAGRLQHRIAAGLEMIDVAQARMLALHTVEQRLQPRLALRKRQGALILGFEEQQVEGEEDQVFRLVVGECGLQCREIRRAMAVECNSFAVEDAIRQRLCLLGDRREFPRPVETLARAQRRLAILNAKLQPVAIELHLMGPARAAGDAFDQLGQLRFDELRHGGSLLRLCLALRRRSCVSAILLVALPDRARAALLARHERLGRLARAQRDLLQGASRSD